MNTLQKISRRFAWLTLALVCLASFSMMLWASRTDSAIMDELAHIPAGYGYVHDLDYRLNPEHPPLIKAFAMLPVLLLNPTFPTNIPAWQTALNGQWDMGSAFLYESGNDANAIVRTARIFPIIFTLLAIILVYALARKRIGDWWALLPTILFAFDPTVLAHGHYVTTDVGATFGILLSLYFFLRYTESPTTPNLWLAGITFGIAQIAKFSTPLLIPLYIFLVFVLWLRNMISSWSETPVGTRLKKFAGTFINRFWKLLLMAIIGYGVILYPTYLLFTAREPIAKQVADTQTILTSFAGGTAPAGQHCSAMRCLAELDIKMAGNPITRPFAEYLLGLLMVIQRADGGNTIYFLGHVVQAGGPMYFPLLYLLKEPIPSLVIVIGALLLALWWTIKTIAKNASIKKNAQGLLQYLTLNFTEFSLASFIVLYWTYSVRSPLNIGLRHVIPTLPLIAILAAGVWKKWMLKFDSENAGTMAKSVATGIFKYIVLIILLLWLMLETLIAAPRFLSYFNEFAGGTTNGYHYVTDSNYDWGQDLLRLKTWINGQDERCSLIETTEPCGIDKIAVDYFGGGKPSYELGGKEIDWNSAKGNPADQNIHWLAVSVNTLESATQPLAGGQTRNLIDSYSWLTALRPPQPGMGNLPKPDYRVGTSIFVYHL